MFPGRDTVSETLHPAKGGVQPDYRLVGLTRHGNRRSVYACNAVYRVIFVTPARLLLTETLRMKGKVDETGGRDFLFPATACSCHATVF